jgi:hypothetical protein
MSADTTKNLGTIKLEGNEVNCRNNKKRSMKSY